jgi:dipeptidyl aminopeptidase/acylaminoacyl peptidase
MEWYWWCLIAIGGVLLLALLLSLYCYVRMFYVKKPKPLTEGQIDLPPGHIYEPYHEQMSAWIKERRALPQEDVEIVSFDGLTLRGKYFECKKGAPMEIQFHGYQGNCERDLSGGVERCFKLGRNVLQVDHRGCGTSDGHFGTFGIRERLDCLAWVDFAVSKFGPDVEIMITGVSMGAATVVMASAAPLLPPQVKGVLADCGFSSAEKIIKKVVGEMHLPPAIIFPFIKFGARIWGGFDLVETSPVEAAKKAKVPIVFVHGDCDDFVPHEMSVEMYEACTAPCRMITIKGAGHGLAYPADREGYLAALDAACKELGIFEKE